jgi:DNA polymerase-3 subunit epsilon
LSDQLSEKAERSAVGSQFGKDEDGVIVFIRGKYKGRSLSDIAASKPDYLEWMQREDFYDDTKAIAAEALERSVARAS